MKTFFGETKKYLKQITFVSTEIDAGNNRNRIEKAGEREIRKLNGKIH